MTRAMEFPACLSLGTLFPGLGDRTSREDLSVFSLHFPLLYSIPLLRSTPLALLDQFSLLGIYDLQATGMSHLAQ